ncbi:nucleotidyl transferase AbiEii/AbiGii toxin family protein [Planctomycetota bacterium]
MLRAVAGHDKLKQVLVLKGAYATEAITGTERSTTDIDLTARQDFCTFDQAGEESLKHLFFVAVEQHLEVHDRDWTLETTSARKKPKGNRHPFGWDGFFVKVTLLYRRREQQVVELDVSFGDFTSGTVHLECCTTGLRLTEEQSTHVLEAYSPEQVIAEKLRAFLQQLPTHRKKIGARANPPRVRDIRDIAVLMDSTEDALDWESLAASFRDKCAAKSVDCRSPADFAPEPDSKALYRELYNDDEELRSVPFERAWKRMIEVVDRLIDGFGPPGEFPPPERLPDLRRDHG